MSDPRTTSDWEALLDGTTPGPWARSEHETDEPYDIRTADQRSWIAGCGTAVIGGKTASADAELIAAAPEAVAEVVRLRREMARLAEFIDGYPLQQVLVASPTSGQRALDMQAKSVAIIKHLLGGDTHE